jgi:hypothetical protein
VRGVFRHPLRAASCIGGHRVGHRLLCEHRGGAMSFEMRRRPPERRSLYKSRAVAVL